MDQMPAPLSIRLDVNGRRHDLAVYPHELLLDVLRDRLDLKGAKRSCDSQVCGACTVLVDGLAVSACTYLAVEADGRAVLTVEGLADGETLHPLQRAFVDRAAVQCGFCTPGMLLTTLALIVGLIEIGLSVGKLGFVADLLSKAPCLCLRISQLVLEATRMKSRPKPHQSGQNDGTHA